MNAKQLQKGLPMVVVFGWMRVAATAVALAACLALTGCANQLGSFNPQNDFRSAGGFNADGDVTSGSGSVVYGGLPASRLTAFNIRITVTREGAEVVASADPSAKLAVADHAVEAVAAGAAAGAGAGSLAGQPVAGGLLGAAGGYIAGAMWPKKTSAEADKPTAEAKQIELPPAPDAADKKAE